jgi:hypothetical protein
MNAPGKKRARCEGGQRKQLSKPEGYSPLLARQEGILPLLRAIVESLSRIEKQLNRMARVREVELELWSRPP